MEARETLAEAARPLGLEERLKELAQYLVDHPPVAAGAAIVLLVYVLAWCRMFRKAGYPSALGFFALLPPLTLLFPLVLGFLPSPVDRELRTLRGIRSVIRQSDARQLRRAA